MRGRTSSALQSILESADRIHASAGDWYTQSPPRLLLISPLADGADQLVAEEALNLGFALHALLPFAKGDYRSDLLDEESRGGFDRLLARAERVLELPGLRGHEAAAYAMTGRATVAHCDLLIAVWDGLDARGRGGTAEVVQLALKRGTPVLHIPIDETEPLSLLWSAFDPSVITETEHQLVQRPLEPAQLDHVLGALLLPPPDVQERKFLEVFLGERARQLRPRIEYPLLLAATGVARFRPKEIRDSQWADAIEREWQSYREGCIGEGIEPQVELLKDAYSWSDRLATHFAQTYRSGHVFNFLLGGLAVCIGLSTFMVPRAALTLALIEFVITFAIIFNTRIGVRNEWHRRWLDYRQLAERLRPMRSLKLLGLAAPDAPGSIANPVPKRWIDWYAAGVWRAMCCPAGSIDAAQTSRISKAVAGFDVAPQVAYHERTARQIDALDSRLEWIATLLFVATLLACVAVVVGQLFAPPRLAEYDNWLTLISAGFPALGTAVFGIRFQGDFGGTAVRSQTTANALRQIHDELVKDIPLDRASDLAEQAARIMLSDLDEWRLINQQQNLDIA
jgi:hypothetical protein